MCVFYSQKRDWWQTGSMRERERERGRERERERERERPTNQEKKNSIDTKGVRKQGSHHLFRIPTANEKQRS